MSQAIVQSIIAHAATDAEFRGRLLQTPASTLADYNLTSAESLALRRLSAESFNVPAAELEVWISKSAGVVWGS